MKTLYLLRHGHAEDRGSSGDASRNLDEIGRAEVRSTAEYMLKAGLRPDIILSSHAKRAFQTAEIVAEHLGYPVKNIRIEKNIYKTDERDLLDIIRGLEDEHASALLAGHNPEISQLAQELDEDMEDHLPTAGLVMYEAEANSWSAFKGHNVRLLNFIYPGMKK
jgi:phosphohistidine phosphatase